MKIQSCQSSSKLIYRRKNPKKLAKKEGRSVSFHAKISAIENSSKKFSSHKFLFVPSLCKVFAHLNGSKFHIAIDLNKKQLS